jgi:hypothetical protein
MLERIDVDVIHLRLMVVLIPDQVFPIPALPDAAFAARR